MFGSLVVKDKTQAVAVTAITTTTNSTAKELTARQKEIAASAEAKLGSLSDAQKSSLLSRVVSLQSRLDTLNISQTRKAAYAEILEVLVHVLS